MLTINLLKYQQHEKQQMYMIVSSSTETWQIDVVVSYRQCLTSRWGFNRWSSLSFTLTLSVCGVWEVSVFWMSNKKLCVLSHVWFLCSFCFFSGQIFVISQAEPRLPLQLEDAVRPDGEGEEVRVEEGACVIEVPKWQRLRDMLSIRLAIENSAQTAQNQLTKKLLYSLLNLLKNE